MAHLAALVAMALSASAPSHEYAVLGTTLAALGPAPERAIHETTLSGLAPAPQKVILETKSFGTVTVDHAAHLARRAACKGCHGPGPVSKIGRFEPKIAHERCVGCHKQEQRGPTSCRDCHAVPVKASDMPKPEAPPPESSDSKVALASAPIAPGIPPSLASAGATPTVPPGPSDARGATLARLDEERLRRPAWMRVVGVGYSVQGGPGQALSTGPAVPLSMREKEVLLVYALERGATAAGGRTLGLIGAGVTAPMVAGWNGQALLLGGFDAAESPVSFAPTVGLRAGAEWLGRRTALDLAVTFARDLGPEVDKLGQRIGGTTVSFSASIGYVLNRE